MPLLLIILLIITGGQCWARTSDLCDVNAAL